MALQHARLVIARRLKMAVDVAREDEGAVTRALGPLLEHRVARVRRALPADLQRASVELPRVDGLLHEAVALRERADVALRHARRQQRSPQAARAAKIRQAGVHAHARAGGDDDGVRVANPVCGALNVGVIDHDPFFLL